MLLPVQLHLCIYVSSLSAKWQCVDLELFSPTAGTISGEEVPIVSKTNIKEYRDSFSCEKFTFRSNPNITFYVYVSNFSWPIKIQVRTVFMTLDWLMWSWYNSDLILCYVVQTFRLLTRYTVYVCSHPKNISLMSNWSQCHIMYIERAGAAIFADAELHCCSGWFQVHFILITDLMSDC